MAIKRFTAIMRFGARKVQAELSRIVVILDYLSAVRFAVDRTDKLVLINRNQYRARFPANLIRRRYAIDFAQRRRIRCSQRLNVRMIARGLNVDIQRLTRAQIRHLTMGIALQTERVHPRLVGKPVIQIIERIVVRRGRAARTGIRLLNRRERRCAANAIRRQVVVTLERAHRVLRIPAVVAGDLSVVILQRRQRGLDVADRRAGGAEGIVAARIAAAAVVRDDQGRTFYEHPDAFTTTRLVFFPRLTDSELALYQADAIYEDEIEVLPRRRPQVPTVLFSFCDEPNHIKAEFLRGKTVLIDFIDVDDTPELRETVRRWMLEIPKSLPAAVVVSVMFKNKQLIAWKFDYESKKYKRFA